MFPQGTSTPFFLHVASIRKIPVSLKEKRNGRKLNINNNIQLYIIVDIDGIVKKELYIPSFLSLKIITNKEHDHGEAESFG
jgi:hypothetical protein